MTNDFNLFAASDEDGAEVDPDIALIVAYLSRELSAVQVAAVNERLTSDAIFAKKVQPLIDAWQLAGSWDMNASAAARTREMKRTTLTAPEIESHWQQYDAASHNAHPSPATASVQVVNRTRGKLIMRIAATVAVVLVPIALAAQLVIYAANHEGALGHGLASRLVGRHEQAPSDIPPYSSDTLAFSGSVSDAPLQIPLTPSQQAQVPVVELSAPNGRTTEKFGAILGLSETADGRVLVNDIAKHQIKLFDKSMASAVAVHDSARGSARTYPGGNWPRPLMRYSGDSLLFGDVVPNQMVVLDQFGEVKRAVALDDGWGNIHLRNTGIDAKGRIIYQGNYLRRATPGVTGTGPITVPCSASLIQPPPVGFNTCTLRAGGAGGASGRGDASGAPSRPGFSVRIPALADSVSILRADLDLRRVDTVGYLRRVLETNGGANVPPGGGRLTLTLDANGEPVGVVQVINPLYYVDEFAVLSDGTIAIVRGSDYHVDWIHPDGAKSASPKLPFEWKRISDDEKKKIIDSVSAHLDSINAWATRRETGTALPTDSIAAADSARKVDGDANCGTFMTMSDDNGRVSIPKFRCPPERRLWPYKIVPPSENVDYYPPFRPGAAIADRDGNLWILPRTTSQSKNGELVYDVVNPKQGFVQRVRLPLGRSIAGFGKGGVVYLQVGDIRNGFFLERTTILKNGQAKN